MNPQAAKALLRVELKKLRESLAPSERKLAADKILGLIIQLPEWQKAQTVCLYASFQGELPTDGLIQSALRAGKKVALPRVAADSVTATLHLVSNPASLILSNLGIPEPDVKLPIIAPTTIDLFLVPGIGFDREGNRLGHGVGFYDRLLAAAQSKGFRLGYGYDFQVVPAIPNEPHDIRVNAIATPSEIITARTH
jgi:5-formyltetrahydrofolate cyclo-ligase